MAWLSTALFLVASVELGCDAIFGSAEQCSSDSDCAHFGAGAVCEPTGMCSLHPTSANSEGGTVSPAKDAGASDSPAPPADAIADTFVSDATDAADAADAADAGPRITFVMATTVAPVQNVMSIDVNTPSTTAGDVIVLGLFTDVAATTVTTPTGWTQLGELAGDADTHGWWYSRIVANGEAAKTTFNFNQATPNASAIAAAYRGVNPAKVVDVKAFAKSDGTTTYTVPSVTTTVARTRLVAIYLADDTIGATWTAPTGMSVRGATGIVAFFDERLIAAGASGARSATSTMASAGVGGIIALTPL